MADGFDDEADAEPTISIGDYLKAVEEEELEADLVLGGDEGKECTYNKGYIKRQAIFSCLTCTPDGNAGVCTACSLSCHEGHEIVELWTKRNFRCDCGNSKFGEFFCKLMANKEVENTENKYNHNFKGTYCTCDQPYPDPNVEEQVEMIQCCICEDWFHEEHINLQPNDKCCICEDWFHEEHINLQPNDKIPRDEEGEPLYEDFICQMCAGVCSFLTCYPQIILASEPSDTPKEPDVLADSQPILSEKVDIGDAVSNTDLETIPKASKAEGNSSPQSIVSNTDLATIPNESNAEGNSSFESTAPKESNAEGIVNKESTEVGGPSSSCIIRDLVGNSLTTGSGKPLFLSKNWREVICRCKKCSNMYAQRGLSFLLDKEDSIAEYETMAKQKRNENMQKQEGAEMGFLNNLGHVEKIEILNGIADMKNEFCSFLESSDPSKPITPADVQQVFENLAKKRKRMG